MPVLSVVVRSDITVFVVPQLSENFFVAKIPAKYVYKIKDSSFRSGWCASGELTEGKHNRVNVLLKGPLGSASMLFKDKILSLLGVFCNYNNVKSKHSAYALVLVHHLFCWRNVLWFLVYFGSKICPTCLLPGLWQ